jgi:hypothetical protein
LRSGIKTTLVIPADPSQVSISDGNVVYDAHHGDHQVDAMSIKADGTGKPVQLTTTGKVYSSVAAHGYLSWLRLNDGYDPLWVSQLDSSKQPVQLVERNEGNQFVGDGFVVWWGWDIGLVASRLAMGSPILHLETDPTLGSGLWRTDGKRVVWSSNDNKIHLAELN